jgi:hypothetical protein
VIAPERVEAMRKSLPIISAACRCSWCKKTLDRAHASGDEYDAWSSLETVSACPMESPTVRRMALDALGR